jgi:hypothetical protein
LFFTVRDLFFPLHDIFQAGLCGSAGRSDGLYLADDLFDDCFRGTCGIHGGTRCARLQRYDLWGADKGAGEKVGLAFGDFGLSDSDVVFPSYQSLRALWREVCPEAMGRLVGRGHITDGRIRVGWCGCGGDAIGRQRKHDGEDGEDKREDEEESGG